MAVRREPGILPDIAGIVCKVRQSVDSSMKREKMIEEGGRETSLRKQDTAEIRYREKEKIPTGDE